MQSERLRQAGRKRVVIDDVWPQIDAGRFPIKRIQGDKVDVFADILADGHDLIRAVVRYRRQTGRAWKEALLRPVGNDRYHGTFSVADLGYHEYTVEAWIDHFESWATGLRKKHDAAVASDMDLRIGAELIAGAAARAKGTDAATLKQIAEEIVSPKVNLDLRVAQALDEKTEALVQKYPDRSHATRYDRDLRVWVDRKRAEFSAWYELFPRSASGTSGRHGTFRDVIERLPYVARLGFDVLYLPPIHPIGHTKRKGANNALNASPTDPGSPWAIGSEQGGHDSIHPELGTLEEFRELVERTRSYQMEIALDIAFQCSPDHPWVKEHPEWFVQRPDGSIQFAENPPKKYEDIFPLNFETPQWEALWQALKGVFDHWIAQGVRVFRVDNPHTKSFPFWEWLIEAIHQDHPEALFLAEAFTRPKRMYRLAKGGFSQSYTYFTWRNSPAELRDYLTELTNGEPAEFFRPNFWPNTPDILHEDLQTGRRAAFQVRLALAALLSSNYGMYGPAFELMDHVPREKKNEEYLNSEKYQIRDWTWDWDVDAKINDAASLAPFISRINAIRRSNPALHKNSGLKFHNVDNRALLCFSKATPDRDNVVFVCVNMDYEHTQSGFVEFSPPAVGLPQQPPFVVRDVLTGVAYTWREYWNFVELDPKKLPVHIFTLELHEVH
ncbi:MAG: alpha-1,4-glucan--maltose-1-phosphate maltosyltransferase [Alkalispirochaeta sp.]